MGGLTKELNKHRERGTPIPKALQLTYDNIAKEIEERKEASETEKKMNKPAARKKSNSKDSSDRIDSTKSKASKDEEKMSDGEASDASDVDTLISDDNRATLKIKVKKEDDLFEEGELVDPTSRAGPPSSKSDKDLVASQHSDFHPPYDSSSKSSSKTADHEQKRGASPGTSSQTESSRGKRPKVAQGGDGALLRMEVC